MDRQGSSGWGPRAGAFEPLEQRLLLSVSLLKDINAITASSDPSSMVEVNGAYYFAADDGLTGPELWKTDGTEAGTVLVKDIDAWGGSNPTELTTVGDRLFFVAHDTPTYWELWKSDGTEAGTVLVKDINPSGNSDPTQLTAVGDRLFFVADDNLTGAELWRSDGTEAGTVLVKDIVPGSYGSGPSDLIDVDGLAARAPDQPHRVGHDRIRNGLDRQGALQHELLRFRFGGGQHGCEDLQSVGSD